MLPAIKKLVSNGLSVFIFPEIFQKVAIYQTVNGVNPRNTIIDKRSEEEVLEDEQGV